MKISSPVAYGSGAYIVHKSLESRINGYHVEPYHPYWGYFPPVIRRFSDKSADLAHVPVDYAIFSKLGKKPLISTFHSFVLDSYIRKYSTIAQRLHYSTDLKWFISKALIESSVITCVSNYLAKLVKTHFDYEEEIRVISNGIDTNLFRPLKNNVSNNKKIKILFCGNPSVKKGFDIIPEILNNTDSNIELLYTSGLRSYKSNISHERARCVGSLPHDEMVNLYNEVDMLLFPTVREGFGLAVAEAMACGLPIVATDCSSLPELVDNGKGGFLCARNNVELFSDSITTLAESPDLRKKMGQYNRVKIESNFTLNKMICSYTSLFEEVLS